MTATITANDLRPRCTSCRAFLARDNPGPRCSPCDHAQLRARFEKSRVALPTATETQAREAFRAGGLPELARRLNCTPEQALELTLAKGLVPPIYRRRASVVRRLIELQHLSHVAAAAELRLSRWTVASYRKDLGLS